MCGIVGWIAPAGNLSRDVLERMRDCIAHRGPDGTGLWVTPDGRVGLAHRRLSIIDLSSSAAQPMQDGDGKAVIVFNGEIYNHRALRRDLEAAGRVFRTDHSDTETLLHGYLEWGIDRLLEKLVGMFAFALYDRRRECLHLVRDRIGIKPLYLTETSAGLLFASEAKALLTHPAVTAELDLESYYHYLTFRAVPAPRSLFRNIEKLAAGERLEIDTLTGTARRLQWWDPLQTRTRAPASLAEAEDQLEALLESALAHRFESDVPVGLFLSGGLDSGYLLHLAAHRADPLNTYTVRYPGFDAYNENDAAATLAAAAGATHHDVPVQPGDFLASMAKITWHQDEPIAAPVCASVFFLSQKARESGVPVVLAGEGSDEIFVGYDNWMRFRNLQRLDNSLPQALGRPLRWAAHALARSTLSPLSTYPEILRRATTSQPLFWSGALDFGEQAKQSIIGPAARSSGLDTYASVVEPLWNHYRSAADEQDITGWMTYTDLRFRLPELMLPRLDRMGMAFSIEGRVPFLDHRIVEFVMGLPPAWRGGTGRETKALFKSVAARHLPHEFVYQRKRGFQAPVREWKHEGFEKTYVPALIEFADRTALLDPHHLRRLLSRRNDRLYFSLVNFMLWYLIFIDNPLPDSYDPLLGPADAPWRSPSV